MMRWLIIFILLPLNLAVSQAIQEYSVYDFGGGLVTSFKNSRLQDNMATVLIDYDIEDGVLVRRQGSTALYRDDLIGPEITKIIPYYVGREKSLLLIRRMLGYSMSDSILDSAASLLVRCDPATEQCTTLVDDLWYFPYRFRGQPYNISTAIVNDRLIISSTKTELEVYTPTWSFPARPLAPGQPEALAIDSNGNVNGIYTYKYAWLDITAAELSRFSPRSWPVNVNNGKVYLRMEGMTDTTTQDWLRIFRKHQDSALYKELTTIDINDSFYLKPFQYIDNTLESTLGAGVAYNWGIFAGCSKNVYPTISAIGPGAMTVEFVNQNESYSGRILKGIDTSAVHYDSLTNVAMSYSMAYIDSSGRTSNFSVISCEGYYESGNDTGFTVNLTNIPVPIQANIVSKVIVRKLTAHSWRFNTEDVSNIQEDFFEWRTITTLDDTTTTYSDRVVDAGWLSETTNRPNSQEADTNYYPDPETINEDDSLVSFQPDAIVLHGSRLWMSGDPDNRNRIYFSDFGRPTTVASSAFLAFPSAAGDWIVNMVSLSNDEMYVFLQNSIYGIKGLSFYQFFADKVAVGVGLSARRTLSRGAAGIFYVHKTGVYKFGETSPISFPIQSSVDSVTSQLPYSFGTTVKDEYWWSVSGKTYIFASLPTPHWKTYSMNITDMVLFDPDTLALDYETGDWVVAMNDSLYQWGDCDTCTTDAGVRFEATYKSKAFLDNGMNREKIFYIDIDGSGSLTICDTCVMNDSLNITIMDKLGTDTLFNKNVYIDFSDNKKDRVMINKIAKDCTVGIRDFGGGDYRIEGYVIGWVPWDGGRMK